MKTQKTIKLKKNYHQIYLYNEKTKITDADAKAPLLIRLLRIRFSSLTFPSFTAHAIAILKVEIAHITSVKTT